ncbi:MAG: hypothetical protein IT377_11480 [Polyangiaceae bacterium]|nr:hypothetical protein [Polyangiaceae bacterium]
MFAQPEYDVVERVLVYRLPEGAKLEPGTRYTVELLTPSADDDFGFRAFDGAPLGVGEVPLRFDFRTRKSATVPPPPTSPVFADTCSLLEALAPGVPESKRAGCASNSCHGGADARMGLRLDNAEGLAQTAIDHVAHQTESGVHAGQTLENPPRLGVNMPIIDRGRPENSYLMYKLLLSSSNFRGNPGVGCTTVHQVALPAEVCPEPTAAESARLAAWFVRGSPMPQNDRSVDLRGLQAWIRNTTLKVECAD